MADSVASATLRAAVVIFSFDPNPEMPSGRALHWLRNRRDVPSGGLQAGERFAEAAARIMVEAMGPTDGRRAHGGRRLTLIGLDDAPSRNRSVTAWYLGLAPHAEPGDGGEWTPLGRTPKATFADAEWLKVAAVQLRSETRFLAGAVALLGEVFTADDLLRLHVAIHGGPAGSERTFRRRIQEFRESGALRSIRAADVPAIRRRVERFRSPSGTGGRPPELLRFHGGRGEQEELVGLRPRRAG